MSHKGKLLLSFGCIFVIYTRQKQYYMSPNISGEYLLDPSASQLCHKQQKLIVRIATALLIPILNSILNFYRSEMVACCHLLLTTYKVRWWCGSIFVYIFLRFFLMWFSHTIDMCSQLFLHFTFSLCHKLEQIGPAKTS